MSMRRLLLACGLLGAVLPTAVASAAPVPTWDAHATIHNATGHAISLRDGESHRLRIAAGHTGHELRGRGPAMRLWMDDCGPVRLDLDAWSHASGALGADLLDAV